MIFLLDEQEEEVVGEEEVGDEKVEEDGGDIEMGQEEKTFPRRNVIQRV